MRFTFQGMVDDTATIMSDTPVNPLSHLNGLVAFEAVMRLGSIKAAAAEACVTDGALSRKISQLEQAIGAPLFLREPRRLTPTALATAIYPDVQAGFERLKAIQRHIAQAERSDGLTIAAPTTFLSRWLIPRQASLQEALGDTPLLFSTYHGAPAMSPSPADIFIAVGEQVDGWQADYIDFMPQTLALVVQRDLYMSRRLNADFARTLPRFVPASFPNAWDVWQRMSRGEGPVISGPLRELERMSYAIEAVESGQGCTVVFRPYVETAVASGRLVVLHQVTSDTAQFRYHVPAPVRMKAKTQTALRWLQREGARDGINQA